MRSRFRTPATYPRAKRRDRRVRGAYRCGWCLELGHTRKICPRARPVAARGFKNANEAYQANRALGLCDSCGRLSPHQSNCWRCRKRRKLFPSRDPKNARYVAQRKQWRLNAKRCLAAASDRKPAERTRRSR